MSDSSQFGRLGQLLDEYLQRLRQGENVTPEDYAANYPEFAAEIRELFAVCEDVFRCEMDPALSLDGHPPKAMEFEIPKEIGEFEIIREIGRGGMGIVFEAFQSNLNRKVALKILPSIGAADPSRTARFIHEAKAVASLNHPNIVPVYATGQFDQLSYFAMQLIDGISFAELRDHLVMQNASGSFERNANAKTIELPQFSSPREQFRWIAEKFIEIAKGLGFAHRQGIIHRDIKPANLLLDKQQHVWVADFGLAKSAMNDLTQTGDLLGTLQYIAPERLAGQTDERSDVFSLGLTLYELVTKASAFQGSDHAELIAAVMRCEIIAPSKIDSSVPAQLEAIILKSLAEIPSDRYQTMDEFAEDLSRFLTDEPVLATIPSRRTQSPSSKSHLGQRSIAAKILLFLVAACSVVGIGYLASRTWSSSNENVQDARSTSAQIRTAKSSELDPAVAQLKFESAFANARATATSMDAGRRQEMFVHVAEAMRYLNLSNATEDSEATRNALRQLVVDAVPQLDMERPVRFRFDPENPEQLIRFESDSEAHKRATNLSSANTERPIKTAPHWSMNHRGDQLAIRLPNGEVALVDVDKSKSIQRIPGNWKQQFPYERLWTSFSHDDRFLLIRGVDEQDRLLAQLIELSTLEVIWEQRVGEFSESPAIVWCHQTNRFAYLNEQLQLAIHDVETNESKIIAESGDDSPRRLTFTPDDQRILLGFQEFVSILDSETGKLVSYIRTGSVTTAECFSPDGNEFVVGFHDGRIEAFQVDGSRSPNFAPQRMSRQITKLQFHPTQPYLSASDLGNQTQIWNWATGELELKAKTVVSGFNQSGDRLAYELDGKEFGFYDFHVPDEVQLLRTGRSQNGDVVSVDFRHDNRFIAWASRHHGISLWDLDAKRGARISDGYLDTRKVRFAKQSDALIASGATALEHLVIRYPVDSAPQTVGTYSVDDQIEGRLELAQLGDGFFITVDGTSLATIWKLDLEVSNQLKKVSTLELELEADFVTTSDSHRIAFSSRDDPGIEVLELQPQNLDNLPVQLPLTDDVNVTRSSLAFPERKGCIATLSHKGEFLAAGTNGKIKVFRHLDLDDDAVNPLLPSEQFQLTGLEVSRAGFSSNDSMLAYFDGEQVVLSSTTDMKKIIVLPTPFESTFATEFSEEVGDIRFSPNDECLAVGTRQNAVIVWHLPSFEKALKEAGLDW